MSESNESENIQSKAVLTKKVIETRKPKAKKVSSDFEVVEEPNQTPTGNIVSSLDLNPFSLKRELRCLLPTLPQFKSKPINRPNSYNREEKLEQFLDGNSIFIPALLYQDKAQAKSLVQLIN
jgi:hypothetical protein